MSGGELGAEVPDPGALCQEIRAMIVARLVRYCGDVDVAEEAFQEAMARTCDRWTEVRTMRSPAGWVWRVALNVVHDHHRRQRLERRYLRRQGAEATVGAACRDRDVVAALWLERALDELPDDQRTVLEMRYLQDRSVRQVADDLDRPVGTIKSLAHRGARALRTSIA